MAEKARTVRVFISYSHEDEYYLKKLESHLSVLRDNGYIQAWDDRRILGGTGWNEAIVKAIDDAELILLLLSPDYLNSSYIRNYEIRKAFERLANGTAIVVPILLRPIVFEVDQALSQLQFLPPNARPVNSRDWDSEDEAFASVTRGLLAVIEDWRGRTATESPEYQVPIRAEAGDRERSSNERESAWPDWGTGTAGSPGHRAESFKDKNRPTVGIVGMGFAGTVTAIRILELATKRLNLLLVEPAGFATLGGLAYGDLTCGWEHLLNIQAGRISLYRERPTDFLEWANLLSLSEKSTWPTAWKDMIFVPSSAVPRQVYGQYLTAKYQIAKEQAKELVEVREVAATVEDIQERNTTVELSLHANGRKEVWVCGRVVVSTGHDRSIVPVCLEPFMADPRIIDSPYSRRFFEGVAALSPRDEVLILGTGLTAYDAVLTLLSSQFMGKITMLSRHGLTHKPYPSDHLHDILPLPSPPVPASSLSADEMLAELDREIERGRAFFRLTQPQVTPDIVEERVLKALEPWVSQWIQRSEAGHVKSFLERSKSRITTSRTGIVPEVNSLIRNLRFSDQRLNLRKGEVERIWRGEHGFSVKIGDSHADATPSLIVCCLGANADYTRTGIPLWKALLEKGLAQPHPKTGRGVSVNHFGALVRGDGSISERLFAVGPMRQGDEIERNGRLGAFVFSVGTIRNQALLVALRILWLTEDPVYAQMNRFDRRKLDLACKDLFADGRNSGRVKRLVNAILAVRLSGAKAHLQPGGGWAEESGRIRTRFR